jgi:hypothetical protein
MKLLIFLCCISNITLASSVHFDIGNSKTNYNRFSIPNNSASQIDMPRGAGLTSFSLTGFMDLASQNQFYFLLAPLEVDYAFSSTNSFRFNNSNFSAGQTTNVSYKFNSYRLGYLWTWNTQNLKYWVGVVGKIRDAEITIMQNSVSDSYDNVGFVPLASFGFEWLLASSWSVFSHTDALAASQGSAFDSQLELKYRMGNFATSIGARILGGGADNDSVYTFAQFDTNYLRISFLF